MAEIVLRDLDEDVVRALERRARNEGRSLESEIRTILEGAAKLDVESARERLEAFRRRFEGRQMADSVELLREARDS